MRQPLQIVFRGLEWSQAIAERVRVRAAKLEQLCDGILGCRVAVEARHRHHRRGNRYYVRVDLTVPGAELVANREPDENHAYADVYVAIRDAFDSIERQLEDYEQRRRNPVKTHEPPALGRVVELHPEADYGRIETPDGRLIYFHRNRVLGGAFDRLEVGSEVRFAEEMGEKGPQASTVWLVGKRHIVG